MTNYIRTAVFVLISFTTFSQGSPNQNRIKQIPLEIQAALKAENYEKAAELRDSLQSLNYIIREEIKISSQDTNYDYIHINSKDNLSIFIGFVRYGRYLGGNLIYFCHPY